LLAAAGFVVLVVSRRPRRRRTAEGGATATGPALAAFLRLDARLGERRRRPGESLRELRGRLDPDPELGEALNVVEQECYAPTAPDARSAVDVLDRY
jgi:hypothetical protein